MMCPTLYYRKLLRSYFTVVWQLIATWSKVARFLPKTLRNKTFLKNYLLASSIATATATVIPTMGLLPAPMSPIIST